MGNDMSWEQKCRISALRAACASQFESYGSEIDEQIATDHRLADPDEVMTRRILARAEMFRNALLSNGALDYTPEDVEASQTKQCVHCGEEIVEMKRGKLPHWRDLRGNVACKPGVSTLHTPVESPVKELCPGCGSSQREMPLLTQENGMQDFCHHKWHQL